MSQYAAAPLVSENSAWLTPFGFKKVIGNELDVLLSFRLLHALGFSRITERTLNSLTDDEDKGIFFRSVLREHEEFRSGMGTYIIDDIEKVAQGDAVIAKISVTTHDLEQGGVVSFIIPTDPEKRAVLVTSGGVADPAYANGIAVSVMNGEDAYLKFSEVLATLLRITAGAIVEQEGTNWSDGNNVAATIYSLVEGHVNRVYQLIVVRTEKGDQVRHAHANASGFMTRESWVQPQDATSIEAITNIVHTQLATVLNESAPVFAVDRMGVVGEGAVSVKAAPRYEPVFLRPAEYAPAHEDAFGYQSHPVSTATPPEENMHASVAAAIASSTEPEFTPHDAILTPATESIAVIAAGAVPMNVTSPQQFAQAAEYEVSNPQYEVFATEATAPDATTTEPFDQAAEYLIQTNTTSEPSAALGSDGAAEYAQTDFSQAEFPQYDDAALDAAVDAAEVTDSIAEVGATDPVSAAEIIGEDLTWDDVVTTISGADDGSGDTPVRGFMNPPA